MYSQQKCCGHRKRSTILTSVLCYIVCMRMTHTGQRLHRDDNIPPFNSLNSCSLTTRSSKSCCRYLSCSRFFIRSSIDLQVRLLWLSAKSCYAWGSYPCLCSHAEMTMQMQQQPQLEHLPMSPYVASLVSYQKMLECP